MVNGKLETLRDGRTSISSANPRVFPLVFEMPDQNFKTAYRKIETLRLGELLKNKTVS